MLFLLDKLDGLPPERADLNLGAIAEDSINSDPEGFVKDLQERAGPTSDFATADADGLAVETFVVPDGADLSEIAPATRNPTKQPTSAPTIVPQNTRGTLVICIVVTAGITAILLAFLCFYKGLFRAEGGQGTEKEAAWYSTGIVLLVSLLVTVIVLVIFLLV